MSFYKFFALSLIVLFSGCSTTLPSVSEYRVNANIDSQKLQKTSCKDKSLKVAQAFSSSSLMTLTMNYSQGKHKQYAYTQSQWAESPSSAITEELVKYLRKINLFKNVQVSKSRSKNRFLLETNIEDFMQYFSEDEKSSFARVSVNFALIDTTTNRVIDTHTFTSKVNVKTIDAEGGVIALNSALNDVLYNSGIWFEEICK